MRNELIGNRGRRLDRRAKGRGRTRGSEEKDMGADGGEEGGGGRQMETEGRRVGGYVLYTEMAKVI